MNERISELDLYRKNQSELLKTYNNKIISLVNGEVQGEYPSKVDALEDMKKRGFVPGSVLIIKCTPGDEEYMRRYRSRVDFPRKVA